MSSARCACPHFLIISFKLADMFAVLILLRVNTEVTTSAQRLWDDIFAGEIFRARDVFITIILNLGEVYLLGLAIRCLRAVSVNFFIFFAQN